MNYHEPTSALSINWEGEEWSCTYLHHDSNMSRKRCFLGHLRNYLRFLSSRIYIRAMIRNVHHPSLHVMPRRATQTQFASLKLAPSNRMRNTSKYHCRKVRPCWSTLLTAIRTFCLDERIGNRKLAKQSQHWFIVDGQEVVKLFCPTDCCIVPAFGVLNCACWSRWTDLPLSLYNDFSAL